MKLGIRQGLLSTIIFVVVLAGLVSVDQRVRDRVGDLLGGGDSVSPRGDRISDLGDALVSAIRHQSIENAPLLVFTAVGAVIVVFMVGSSNFKR